MTKQYAEKFYKMKDLHLSSCRILSLLMDCFLNCIVKWDFKCKLVQLFIELSGCIYRNSFPSFTCLGCGSFATAPSPLSISATLPYSLVCHFFVLNTFWYHLRSITEQTTATCNLFANNLTRWQRIEIVFHCFIYNSAFAAWLVSGQGHYTRR